MDETVKIVVFVPVTHADIVREAMGKVGAGIVGDYKYCSFSAKGLEDLFPSILHILLSER